MTDGVFVKTNRNGILKNVVVYLLNIGNVVLSAEITAVLSSKSLEIEEFDIVGEFLVSIKEAFKTHHPEYRCHVDGDEIVFQLERTSWKFAMIKPDYYDEDRQIYAKIAPNETHLIEFKAIVEPILEKMGFQYYSGQEFGFYIDGDYELYWGAMVQSGFDHYKIAYAGPLYIGTGF